MLVCSTSLMASLLRSVGGLSRYFYQGLWLADLNAYVIGQSINRRGVAYEFPHLVNISSSFPARFFLWISKQIPEVMDGPMQHETSDRCRAILKERETVYYHASQWSFYIDLMDSVCGADHRRL